MKKLLLMVGLVPTLCLAQPNPATGPFPQATPFYVSNEVHTLQFTGTNTVYVYNGGDSGVNGNYLLKGTVGGITVWTNVAGTYGIAYDPGLTFFANESSLTNSAASLRYSSGTPFPPAGVWGVNAGVAPGIIVVPGTNTYTTNVGGFYPSPLFGAPGVMLSTNYYFVNPVNGNDTNAVAGNRDRPYKNFTNVVCQYAIHSNDVIFLEAGTNYFGEFDISVSNAVSIIGLGPRDQCWLAKAASKVDVADISLVPGHGSTFENFSGNLATGNFGTTNVTLRNLHLIGWNDCLLASASSSAVIDGGVYEVNGADGNALIDAAVISNSGGGHVIKNVTFVAKRRGNGATTRRALVIKGGTNTVSGCQFIATDTTNNSANAYGCIGLSIEGNGYSIIEGCSVMVRNTNANNYCAYTNAFNASDPDVCIAALPPYIVYSNGVTWWSGHTIATNFIGGQLYTNTYGMSLDVSATVSNVSSATAGASRHALWLRPIANSGVTGRTNRVGDYHQAITAITNLWYIGMRVPPGFSWAFTNETTGANNDSQVIQGQISFP